MHGKAVSGGYPKSPCSAARDEKESRVTHVGIRKIQEDGRETDSALEQMQALTEQVRQLAFQLFESRGGGDGHALEDWLAAEREVVQVPESELIDTNGRYEVRVAVPLFQARELCVTATPTALVIQGHSGHRHEAEDASVRFCELGRKALFRRFEFPDPVDVDTVTARLANGMLRIAAAKAPLPALNCSGA